MKEYNPSVIDKIRNVRPANITIYRNGVFVMNEEAVKKLELKDASRIVFSKDKTGQWFVTKKDNGFLLHRRKFQRTKRTYLLFTSIKLRREILSETDILRGAKLNIKPEAFTIDDYPNPLFNLSITQTR